MLDFRFNIADIPNNTLYRGTGMHSRQKSLKPAKKASPAELLQIIVLAELHKALKAITFYPDGHPQRRENLQQAYISLTSILASSPLSLQVSRSGFAIAGGQALPECNPMVAALARELFLRRATAITFLPDLLPGDFEAFLRIMSQEPQQIIDAGGIESCLERAGITTVWVNEIDLSVIGEKLQHVDGLGSAVRENPAQSLGEEPVSKGEGQLLDVSVDYPFPMTAKLPSISLDTASESLDGENDDSRYLELTRQLKGLADRAMSSGNCAALLPVVATLARHLGDEERSPRQRECARQALAQVGGGAMLDYLLEMLESRNFTQHEAAYCAIAQQGESAAARVIKRLCATESLYARKAFSTALKQIGQPSVGPLTAMIGDPRWYVVRNMVSILGEIGSHPSINHLAAALHHPDLRVRKEAFRSLVKIGGKASEMALIDLLDSRDRTMASRAIAALKALKSRLAVKPLMDIVAARDPFLRDLSLKKEALHAIGQIGDRRATPHLVGLMGTRRLLARNGWEELKSEAALALGAIGGDEAIPELLHGSTRGGIYGDACSRALAEIENRKGRDNG